MKIALVSVLCLVIVILLLRLVGIKRELKHINRQISEILKTDTNANITVCLNDKAIAETVTLFNRNLRELRKKELQIQSKNDEIRTAITNVAHDLRTPLTAIYGYLELLKTEEKSQEVNRCLAIIENRTEAMKKLTEELFQCSLVICGENELRLEEISVNGALEESIAAYYAVFKEKRN